MEIELIESEKCLRRSPSTPTRRRCVFWCTVILITTVAFVMCFRLRAHNPRSRSTLARVPCDVIVPGLERMSHGVDVTRLDMLHDYSVDNVDGYVKALFELSCDEGKSWVSPFDGKRYSVPDQLDSLTALPSGIVYSETALQYHTWEVRESMSAEAGISGLKGTFSLSLSYRDAHNTLTNTSRFVSQSKAFVSTVQLEFIPARWLNASLNRYARDYIDNVLPDKFDDDPGAYLAFLTAHGTHYFGAGNFGGLFSMWFHIENSLRRLETDKEIKANAEATFFGLLKAHGAYDGHVATVSVDFAEHSAGFTRYFGGMANVFDSEGFKHWWPTVAANPWLCSGDLLPVANLLSGPKKVAMETAYDVLLLKASLQEARRTLYSFLEKGREGKDEAERLLAQLQALFGEARPSAQAVAELTRAIDDFVLVPDWFLATTYDISWDNTGRQGRRPECAHQEEKGIPITTPSPPFNMFPVACFWVARAFVGTFTLHPPPTAPSWFEKGVSIRQGPLADGWHWSINVPSTAPGWLSNVKFCLLTQSFFCAPPNHLTPPAPVLLNTFVRFQLISPYTDPSEQKRPAT